MKRRTKIFITLSVVLNVVFLFNYGFSLFTDQLGVLTKDIEVGEFGTNNIKFTLPKGLNVRNISPQGLTAIGQFEPNRFYIVVTTEDRGVVNYSVSKDTLYPFSNLYSMDLRGK